MITEKGMKSYKKKVTGDTFGAQIWSAAAGKTIILFIIKSDYLTWDSDF